MHFCCPLGTLPNVPNFTSLLLMLCTLHSEGSTQCWWVQSVEAARECGMRAVVVAGRKPLYEMGAADLVVRGLDELSFINLKQLFSDEEAVSGNVSCLRPASLCSCAP